MSIKIALVGNPNSGKTTLFNTLTGSNQFVGNWPGVTVEKKEGKLKKSFVPEIKEEVIITDLPGIYSLSPYTPEEVVSRKYLLNEKPDAIINIVDGTNLERNLYLSTQLMEMGIPLIIAVNMLDILEKTGDSIDLTAIEKKLGCKALAISALKNINITEIATAAVKLSKEKDHKYNIKFSADLENIITKVSDKLIGVDEKSKRFYALKLLEKDEKISELLKSVPDINLEINELEDIFDDDTESIITNERYNYITEITKGSLKRKNRDKLSFSDKIDKIVTNRILALPIFALIMFIVYYVSVTTIGTYATDWANDGVFGEGFSVFGSDIPGIPVLVTDFLNSINTADWLRSLIVDGIIGGVGAVLGFVPQMLILFFFLAFLESCGYMARVAFIMDRIFKKFGLSGKSFIPMLVGSGCGVPGIMASRTIENERDRKITIITTTFIPCGAKLPIIALIAGALFDGAWWVAPSAYFLGVGAILLSGIILKKLKLFSGDPSPFVMELPAYHMPTAGIIFRSMLERGGSFIKKAGTVILLSSIFIWFTQGFGFENGSFKMVENMDNSILSKLGGIFAPILSPLGFGNWKAAVATITGLVAKENVVSTFGVLYGFSEVSENGAEIWGTLQNEMSTNAAYAFLIFNLLCAPCFAAIGAIKREMNNGKWFAFALIYQTGLAYAVALIFYQLSNLFINGVFGVFTVVAFIVLLGIMYLLFRPAKKY